MKLPDNWHKRPLGEIFKKIVVGYVGNVNDHYCDASSGIPFYRTLNIRDGYFRHDEIRHVTTEFNDKNKKSQIENDDIVIARVGANLGMVCKVSGLNGMANMANAIIIKSKSAKNTSPDFYTYFLLSSYGKSQIYAGAAGGAQGVFNTKLTQEISVPVPPLPEQKKIAKILSTWDQAISTTEQLLANSQQQKKALMQQLLTGKKRLLDKNGVRFSGEWRTGKLSSLVGRIFGGGTPSRANPELWGGKIPWVTVKDLISTRIDGAQEFINERGLLESSSNLVPAGTVILSTRMAVGKTVIASCDVAINQDLKAISSSEKVCSEYLFYWFLYHSCSIEKMGTGSTVKGVQIDAIKALIMSIPAKIEEQQKIASVLSAADQEITTLQRKLDCLKQEKKALMQALLTGKRRVVLEAAHV